MSNENRETIADDFKERPMDYTKKNALAELAKRLDIIVFGLVTDGHPCDETIDIRKAQRIVAVLANVDSTYVADPVHNNICNMAYDALVKIRAIAEEGAEDGK